MIRYLFGTSREDEAYCNKISYFFNNLRAMRFDKELEYGKTKDM